MRETSPFHSLSVVIPTYNRAQLLAKALAGYLSQSSLELIREVIVVDDGSTDETASIVREMGGRSPFPIRYLHQPNKGPAAARNLGIREASSGLVLFTDSDILPGKNLVQEHLLWHRKNPDIASAVLGYVTWPKDMQVSPFMRWYGENGIFRFSRLHNGQEATSDFFYTCNVSLKTEFLRKQGQFNENFKSAAFEDTELGFRLSQGGLKLLYNRAAIGYHDQHFSFEAACRKTFGNAMAARVFLQTEGGRQSLKELQQKRSRPWFAVLERIATEAVKLLRPVRPLLNSSVPLPGIIYHAFFWAIAREALWKDALVAADSGRDSSEAN